MSNNPLHYLPQLPAVLTNLPQLDVAASGLGSIKAIPPRDGVVRRIPIALGLGDRLLPSLTTEIIRLYQGKPENPTLRMGARGIAAVKIGDQVVPTDNRGNIWGYFTPTQPQRSLSAAAILAGDVDPAQISDYIILIGTTVTGIAHQLATPLSKSGPASSSMPKRLSRFSPAPFCTGQTGPYLSSLPMP